MPSAPPRLVTLDRPYAALGLAAAYLMDDPVFAEQSFGHWTGTLLGQVRRGEYRLAMEEGRVTGFLGWFGTDLEEAARWARREVAADVAARTARAVIVNAVKAERPSTAARLFRFLCTGPARGALLLGKQYERADEGRLYARLVDQNGRMRFAGPFFEGNAEGRAVHGRTRYRASTKEGSR
jgi:hypothetical protein